MSTLRRYEILVPLVFNDGTPVPEELLAQTFIELRDQFGAASWETQVVRGSWEHEGTIYEDNLTRFFVGPPLGGSVEGMALLAAALLCAPSN